MNRVSISIACILLAACSLLRMEMARAEERRDESSEKIQQQLTQDRDICVKPRFSSSGHAVPEASPHVSLPIQFDLDSTSLRAESGRQLDELVAALASHKLKDFRILIEGHTCNLGTVEHNQTLSEQRAESVKAYLTAHGVPAARLETKGWGWTRPVSSNADETHRERNRRVDFVKLESATVLAVNRNERIVDTRGLTGDRFLRIEFLGMKKEGGSAFPITAANNALAAGDMFQVVLTILEGCHVYALFLSSQGDASWLFPAEDVQFGRWCYFGEKHVLPGEGKWNVLDENAGTELVVLIASPVPLPDANALPAVIKRLGKSLNSANLREAAGVAEVEVKTVAIDHK